MSLGFRMQKRNSDPNTAGVGQASVFIGADGVPRVQNEGNPSTPLGGDMQTAVYDPQGINGDSFDTDNHTEGSINTPYPIADKNKLSGIESGATQDQTDEEIETAYNNQVPVVTQPEAEAGTSTDVKRWTPERVRQAVNSVALGPAGGDLTGNYPNPNITSNAVSNDKLSDVNESTIKGRITSGTGDPEDLTATQVRSLINVEDGATADQTPLEIKTDYESNPDTNAFTDAEKTKLANSAIIDDLNITTTETWSSSKINSVIPTKFIINTIDDFPTPVGDAITLPDGEYVLNQTIISDKRFIIPTGGRVRMSVVGATSSFYVYTGTGVLWTGADIASLEFVSWVHASTGAATLFDLDTSDPNAYVLNSQVVISGLGSLGTVKTAAFFMFQTTFDTISQGLILDGNGVTKINGCNSFLWNNDPLGASYFKFIGTQGQINITDFTTIPQSNESIFDFPTAGLILGASVALNSVGFLPAGGTLFNIGSRDQKDPQILLTASAPEPDSNVIGSFYWNRNSTETIINSTASDGAITQFVDSGGGIVTATSIAHGLLNGDIIDISETTNYNGRFTISNVTTDTFSFTSPFNGDDATGIFQFGWVKVGGTTFQGEVERASMTGNNALLFLNLEPRKVLVTVSLTVLRGSGSGSPIAGFSVFRNGQQFLTSNNDAIIGNVVTNSTNSVQFSLNIPGTVIDGDTFELYTRNETNSSNILVQFGTVIIN